VIRSTLSLVRADRLLSLILLLQARGGATARALAAELGVSVRTVYRDLGRSAPREFPSSPSRDRAAAAG